MPFADRLPKPEEVVASGYDFAEHLLALQRKFAEDLLEATVPLMPGNGKSANARPPGASPGPPPRPLPRYQSLTRAPPGRAEARRGRERPATPAVKPCPPARRS